MNYPNIERIINYGTTYRVQELADTLIGLNDAAAYSYADDLCGILITFKGVMPPAVWEKVVSNLLTFTTNVQFDILTEEDEDNE